MRIFRCTVPPGGSTYKAAGIPLIHCAGLRGDRQNGFAPESTLFCVPFTSRMTLDMPAQQFNRVTFYSECVFCRWYTLVRFFSALYLPAKGKNRAFVSPGSFFFAPRLTGVQAGGLLPLLPNACGRTFGGIACYFYTLPADVWRTPGCAFRATAGSSVLACCLQKVLDGAPVWRHSARLSLKNAAVWAPCLPGRTTLRCVPADPLNADLYAVFSCPSLLLDVPARAH
jgi:hypothetical protein